MTEYEKYIRPFAEDFKNDPKYISNKQIENYGNIRGPAYTRYSLTVFSSSAGGQESVLFGTIIFLLF